MRRFLKATAITLAIPFFIGCSSLKEPQLTLRSPDGKIQVKLDAKSALTYSVSVDGKPLLADSILGAEFEDGTSLGSDVEIVHVEKTTADSTWQNRLGKRRQGRDRHNEMRLTLRERANAQETFQVIFRAFDDGVAFRYVFPAASEQTLERERTEFAFPTDAICYAGSQLNGFTGPQEWEFWPTHLAALPTDRPTGLPL